MLERDGHSCVRCAVAIRGIRGLDCSIQHRKPRGQGGTNAVSNLLAVCGSGTTGCHGHMESYRTEAYDLGWLVHRDVDPLTKAVLVEAQSRWTYLDDLGGYSDNPPEVA